MTRALTALLTPLLALCLSAPAAAGDRDTLYLDIGAGVGQSQGLIGGNAELHLRADSGLGASLGVGTGAMASAGARIWFPGQQLRIGLGADMGSSWPTVLGAAGGCDNGGDSLFYLGGSVEADHDVGQSGGFAMRYGVGAAIVGAGCVGGVLPTPTIALRYAF